MVNNSRSAKWNGMSTSDMYHDYLCRQSTLTSPNFCFNNRNFDRNNGHIFNYRLMCVACAGLIVGYVLCGMHHLFLIFPFIIIFVCRIKPKILLIQIISIIHSESSYSPVFKFSTFTGEPVIWRFLMYFKWEKRSECPEEWMFIQKSNDFSNIALVITSASRI